MINPKSEIVNPKSQIGYVVGGSLKDCLRVRLTVPPQQVQEGSFVVIESGGWLFYGLVTDLQLGATDPRFADEQTETRLPAEAARLLHGQTLYTTLEVLPALMLEAGPDPASPDYPAWVAQHPDPGRPVASLAGGLPGDRPDEASEHRAPPSPPGVWLRGRPHCRSGAGD